MSERRAALAVVLVLSGTRTAPAEPCPPRAELGGDAAAVAQVGDELRRLGVELGAAPSRAAPPGAAPPRCRTVRAQVELDREGGIAVAIVDGSRRSEGRVLGSAGGAAAWIDSWLRDDVDGIAAPAALPLPVASLLPAAAPPLERPPPAAAPAPVLGRFALAAAFSQSWTEDGASATGLDGGACLRIGPACIGARAAYAREADRAVGLTAMSRSSGAVLATAGTSIALGRMQVAPEVGLGVGWRRTRRLECTASPPPPPPPCDPMAPGDPTCVPAPPVCTDPVVNGQVYVGDGLDVTTFTPRAAATVRLALPLFDHVWLEGLASLAIAPLGHGEVFGGALDPSGMTPTGTELPGEPLSALELGIGLRIGAR